ncbi:MAG: hypothetical protein Q4C10_10210 [Clostridia bacterium]|nr:hypothetical protein [Clostridia bacterium]
MTITGYSNAIVDVMLGWLKGLANWVLRLFNLAGSARTSPLLWLSQNWLKLLIFFLIVGVGLDLIIWLIRWRPYWVWFRKERVIVNDDRFFESADMDKAADYEEALQENWDEHDYVVASTVVKRQAPGKARGAVVRDGKRPSRETPENRQRRRSAQVKRHEPAKDDGGRVGARDARKEDSRRRAARDGDAAEKQEKKTSRQRENPDNIFAMELQKPDVSDFYEDEVFNVSNLPVSGEDRSAERRGSGKARKSGKRG